MGLFHVKPGLQVGALASKDVPAWGSIAHSEVPGASPATHRRARTYQPLLSVPFRLATTLPLGPRASQTRPTQLMRWLTLPTAACASRETRPCPRNIETYSSSGYPITEHGAERVKRCRSPTSIQGHATCGLDRSTKAPPAPRTAIRRTSTAAFRSDTPSSHPQLPVHGVFHVKHRSTTRGDARSGS